MSFADNHFAFVDTETTGLDIEEGHRILEVGVAIVTRDFEIVDTFSHVIWTTELQIRLAAGRAPDKGEWVLRVHRDNNLIEECSKSDAVDLSTADEELSAFMDGYFSGKKPPMCGSTVGFDRGYIGKYLPNFDKQFHYRSIDISSVKELCRKLNPALYAKVPEKRQELHRVLPDLEDSAMEAKFYADNFFYLNW